MNLRLRDTLTRALRPATPMDGAVVRMYSCGPTVYRYAHVGNLRTFLLADLIRRALLFHGLEVLHVQNITDVGHIRADALGREVDPMLVAAGVEGRPSAEIADAYEAAFHADAALLNLLPAHAFPRATEHIDAMVDLAAQLVGLGHAYVTEAGNVYYAVATWPGYGALSGNSLDELRAGHRTEGAVESDKRDPADFALWKATEPGRELHWPSPWGDGFPGWHLECSAMALRLLGPTFDIHTGGEDNVFPHHEDEIAQSGPIVGGAPARIWVHGAHLLMGGRKMAKSAGNFQRITELAEAGIDPLAFRALCLMARYGRKLNLTEQSLAAAAAGLASLRAEIAALGPPPEVGPWVPPEPLRAGRAPDRPAGVATGAAGHGDSGPFAISDRATTPSAPLSAQGRALHDRFVSAVDDDLDMPTALRVAREAIRAPLPADERRWLALGFDLVLGLDLDRDVPAPRPATDAADRLPAAAEALLAERGAARAARDFATADRIREELQDIGIELVDRPDGTTDWRRPG